MMSRPSRSDGNLTKSKILKVAGQLIAQNGFTQTSNKSIAQAAEVDLASINYHFNGREGLYSAVLIEAHAHFISEQYLIELVERKLSPEEKLEKLFTALLEKVNDKDQWHSKVFIRELLSSSPSFQYFMENDGNRKFHLVCKIISQISGVDEHSPILLPCVLSILAPCLMMIISTTVSTPIHNIMYIDKFHLAKYLTAFALGGLNGLNEIEMKAR